MRTDTLEGAWLDAWVALARGHADIEVEEEAPGGGALVCRSRAPGAAGVQPYRPSTDWREAQPILEEEHILLRDRVPWTSPPRFEAMLQRQGVTWFAEGELPLVAAMRVYVRSRFEEDRLLAPPFDR